MCWWTAAVVIVVLAVALSTMRLLLPVMSDYRTQVETVVANVFKRPVTIASVEADWHKFSPVLRLSDVVIEDPQLPGGRISIQQVEVVLNVFDSLLQGKWRTAGIKVIGIHLDVHTDIRHRLQVLPLQVILDWLLPQDSITVEQVQLVWHDQGLFDAPLQITDLSVQMVNDKARHQLLLEAKLPASLGDSVKISADLQGQGDKIAQWHGTLYLNTKGFQLAALQPLVIDTGVIAGGATNLELWVGVLNAKPVWGSGRLSVQKPQLQNAGADAQRAAADHLSARFHWWQHREKWHLAVSDFELQRNKQAVWPVSTFDFVARKGEGIRLRGQASLLVLDELDGLLPLLPWVDDDALAMFDRLQPTGLMRNAEFALRYHPGEDPKFSMRAAIENLTLGGNSRLPGITGASGQLEGNLQAGYLRLKAGQARLLLPHLFPQPLPLTNLAGDVRWERFKDMFRIEAKHLRLESGPLVLDSRWQMDWSYEQAAPWLDLQLAAQPLPLNVVSNYLPTGVMPARAVNWLHRAFKAGSAENIRVLLQGRLDHMPFNNHQGRFEARFDFNDVSLDYHPTWGQLDELNGEALFSGRSMKITGRSAQIQDSPVQRVVATIRNLNKPVLKIDGTVGGTFAGMLEFVRNSPLKKDFGDLVDAVDTTGDARLQLNLNIPLKHNLGPLKVAGDVLLAGNDILPKRNKTGLTDIHARLHFSGHGISIKKATARLLGQPVVLSVYPQGKAGAAATVVDIKGKLKLIDRIKDQYPRLASWLTGSTRWQALLNIYKRPRPGRARVSLELHSDLKGVAVTLPQPFAKQAAEKRPTLISWVPGKAVEYPFSVNYGDTIKARILLTSKQRLRKAAIRFGDGTTELPAHNEIHLSGKVPVFDLGRWLPVFKRLSGVSGHRIPSSVNLETDIFRLAGVEVAKIGFHSKSTDPWHFTLDGEEAKGWIRWIPAERIMPPHLLAKLDRLAINDNASLQPVSLLVGVQPASLPELNIEVNNLHWAGRNLGQLDLISRRAGQGVHFKTLNIISPAIELYGEGEWLTKDGHPISRFNARVANGDLGRLSTLLGSGGTIKGGTLKGKLQLGWPGTPVDPKLSSIHGEFDLKATDGRLEHVEDGVGKILSLFSLNSLQRRLKLDFRDVVKGGFSFDKMKGHFIVMDGDIFTNDFSIRGTSATIDVTGRTGLVARDYDQLLTVTPQVSSTLPIAGAIAGGPAVGAAVFLADKLIGKQLNRLARVRYQVSGSWAKPVFTRLGKPERKRAPEDIDDEDS